MSDGFDVRPPGPAETVQETMLGLLDYSRGVMVRKLDGLGDEEARRPGTASGVTLLGLVKHLAYVERWWFRAVFAGETVEFPWTDDDPDADWRIEPRETTAAIVGLYEGEIERANAIIRGSRLEDRARKPVPGREVTMGWLLPYMIQEVSRHNGHADILREAIDGRVGR